MKKWLMMSAAMAALSSCCVARGSKVKTPRGNRNVEELEVGDEIIVVDPNTLEQHVSSITAIRRAPRECGRLKFGSSSLTVTSAHPLFDPEECVWAPAGDWLLGVREMFVTETGPMRVTIAERFVGVEDVFDLTVAHELHTFVVNEVVVHNKSPLPHNCETRTADGTQVTAGDWCACGPDTTYQYSPGAEAQGGAYCGEDGGSPFCACNFYSETSWWVTSTGNDDTALRDGTWWSRVERQGDSGVLSVEPWVSAVPSLLTLPGSPNVLRIDDKGDDSSGFVVSDFPDSGISVSGSLWFFKQGTFPRVVSLDGSELVLLGVDGNKTWIQPTSDGARWVATGVPDRIWLKYAWQFEFVEPASYRLHPSVSLPAASYAPTFKEEGTGQSLEDFYADGGVFSLGDGGVTALRLGHQSSPASSGDVLRVTGLSLSPF
jgi:hypothetical protein